MVCLFEISGLFDKTTVQLHIRSLSYVQQRVSNLLHPVSNSVYACSAYAAVDLDLDWRKCPRADGLSHPAQFGYFRSPICNHQIYPEVFAWSCSHCNHLSGCHGRLFWHWGDFVYA